MNRTHVLLGLCSGALLLALAGCTNGAAPATPTPAPATPAPAVTAPAATPAPVTDTPAPAEDQSPEIRAYIEANLPASYLGSERYQLDITQQDGRYAASIVMDMMADGSDFADFAEEDYLMLAELESDYVVGTCLADLPAPTDLTLNLLMGEGVEITVEKEWDSETYTRTRQGETVAF